MRYAGLRIVAMAAAASLICSACGGTKSDPKAEAPPPAQVDHEQDGGIVQVDHPEQIPLATATMYTTTSALVVTGSVTPDVSRNVPVVSLVSGRVVAIHARLGDTVKKDQVLLSIRSDDVSGGFADYRKAVADEILAGKQYERAKDLFAHGAIAQNELEVAQDTEDKAKVDVETIAEHLRLLGNDPDHPNYIVDVKAPVDGVITDQEVTSAGSVQAYGTNPFTISNLANVWVVCDVYENDLANVHLGDSAQITLNAYPGRVIAGRISNIGAILDPNLRTAKVRIEVANPGTMRIGMFVTARFHGQKQEQHAEVPASAILHLHDRDWVFAITPDRKFRRVEVAIGAALPGDMQEVLSGILPGAQVVRDALTFQNTVDQ
ncbi:MAG TPA: efflux RND transporter periplasmic adaptor subunit [Candidatus Sulfotelmatobacter sp.]|jgi:cobalt-zinc-cadmium efflux system membrane fusion protein|nr:efflux RND transporter periplasmic adaptor subunit [Candidatus Sulfotelmatobacter sp.]